MKSIKLASGFAVSALALAIAGQATAQTQTTMSATGEIKFQTIFDLDAEQFTHQFDERAPLDEPIFNVTISVANGPFSGDVILGEEEGGVDIDVDNLRVVEGPISFGDIGRVTATAGLYESLTDENDLFGEDESTRIGVSYAFRYTEAALGLRVQAEASNENQFGIGAALHQNLDVVQFWVDGQYRAMTDGASGMDDDTSFNFGVALQATPVEQVTLTGVYRMYTPAPGADLQAVLAAKLEADITNELSGFVLITDRDLNNEQNDDTTVLRAGLSAALAPFVVSGGYEANLEDLSEGLVFTSATWTDGPLSAFVGLEYSLEGFSGANDGGFELSFGGDFTTASGIVYGAEYTFSEDNAYFGDTSEIELFASYSF